MSIFGDVIGDTLSNLFTFGGGNRRGAKILAKGERATATIDGVRYRDPNDSGQDWRWGLTVHAVQGEFRAGVKRRPLGPVRLGDRVEVVHHKGRVLIDWDPPQLGTPLKKPVAPGIDDATINRKRLEKWPRAEATLVATEPYFAMGMPTQNWHLDLEADGRRVRAKREFVPAYARHLLEIGTVLPVAIKDDKVEIDWATAAQRS